MNAKTIPKNDIEFLKARLKCKQKDYLDIQELCPEDFGSPPGDTPLDDEEEEQERLDRIKKIAEYEKIEERIARLADANKLNGNLFRNLIPKSEDEPVDTYRMLKQLEKEIEVIPKIIAAIQKPVDRGVIPDGAELLTIPQVARKLLCAESMVRQWDNKGLLPIPIRIGGKIQWRKKEIEDWIAVDCPAREKWEQIKKVGGD
ncbi:MAG: helix-turn-helix domain-containing protein [Planctomycetes bacterium]|nr:helix-turn-helix domain-containing protein [Planctomycetota bacterium]